MNSNKQANKIEKNNNKNRRNDIRQGHNEQE